MKRLWILASALFCLSACQPSAPVNPTAPPAATVPPTVAVAVEEPPTATSTMSPSPIPTMTRTGTVTHTMIPSATATSSRTSTATATPSLTSTDTPSPTATPSPTDTPTITLTPTATESPTVTHTPTPVADAVVANAALNLRSGPGDLFEILGSYKQGTPLTLISRLASSAWVEASLPDGQRGWMYAGLLQINIALESVPVNPNPPTRAYNTPGVYDFDDICIRIYVKDAYGDECLWSVEVRDDGRMQFNFRWSAVHVQGTGFDFLIKYSDEGNRNMYITDNLGNRYDHVEIGGAARGDHRMYEGQSVEGWFLFEPAKPGVTSFTFHDDDQAKTFDDIVLLR